MKVEVPDEFYLRPIEDDDHSFMLDLHNDTMVLRNLTHPSPITMDQHLRWWDKTRTDRRQLRLIFVADGHRAGLAKFYDYDAVNQTIVLGADIHKDFRGKGLAKFLWTLMLERCFGGFSVWRVGLTTAEYNEIGQRVYRRIGFKEEGRLKESLYRDGKRYDQLCMYLTRDIWDKQ
jgi:RimJ/RimL family protein N-acetyltransferase